MSEGGPYDNRLDTFLDQVSPASGGAGVPAIFHAVRNIRYASRGDRTPLGVLDSNEGSCSGKHILLRDLLRRAGEIADVEIVEGDFAAGLPVADTMPEALQRWIRNGGIRDFHNYVVWRGPERELKLDATWHDALTRFGFPVNSSWAGEGDTKLALEPLGVKAREEDLINIKARLLTALSENEAADRKAFLELLTDWISKNA
jgi:hypothetical protein